MDRACLGFGVSVTDIVTAASSVWWGSWVVDEIVLRDCYLEDSLDPQTVEDILGVPVR